jgi:hypothetical protein
MFYLAFSIHGTNKFRVFTFDKKTLPEGFTKTISRRPGQDPAKDGTKVHWNGLVNKRTKQPYTNRAWVSRRLNELTAMGWKEVEDLHQR